MKLVERLSAETGKPCFIYRRPIVSDHTQLEACDSILYEPDRFPELFGVFMEGAPCVLLCNANVSLGLVNGATGTMHKLHWKEAADNVEWSAKMANAVPGKLFPIKEPSLIFMKMDRHKDEAFWGQKTKHVPARAQRVRSRTPACKERSGGKKGNYCGHWPLHNTAAVGACFFWERKI